MIKSQITLKQLEALIYVVDTGTFRAAAQSLGTTQPNISSRISALEDTLGVIVMHRDAGSVRLTEIGEKLLAEARRVLLASEAFLEVADRRDLINERLRLGVTEVVAATWLQDFLRALRDAYPAVRVELQVDLSRQIDLDLTANALDLAIQSGPFKSVASGQVPVATYPYTWVASPGIVKDRNASLSFSEIFEHPILTHAKHTVSSTELKAEAQRLGLPYGQVVHSSSLSACVPMVLDGMGIGLLPKTILRKDIADGRLIDIACAWHPSPLEFNARFDARKAPLFVKTAAELAAKTALSYNELKG